MMKKMSFQTRKSHHHYRMYHQYRMSHQCRMHLHIGVFAIIILSYKENMLDGWMEHKDIIFVRRGV
jgi:hypothetical protein